MSVPVVIVQNHPSRDFLIYAYAVGWGKAGLELIQHVGPEQIPDAEILFLHVDLTVVPDVYRDAVANHPCVINRHAANIRRDRYSRQLVDRDDPWDGPVIVKSMLNYGGIPEESDRRRRGERLRSTTAWADARFLSPGSYPVFRSITAVPAGVWRNPVLIVERFPPERDRGLFFVRYWSFFGDQSMTGRLGSRQHIVKFSTMVHDDGPVEPPAELRTLREALGLDYGRFDYVVHDGRTFVLDANKTMGGGASLEPHLDFYARFGLAGIEGFRSGRVRPLGS